jgi:hypothetical protein
MNKLQSLLIKIGILAFSVMFSAIFTLVTLTYASQKKTEGLVQSLTINQAYVNTYTIHRLSYDSIALVDHSFNITKIKSILSKIAPEEYMDQFYDADGFLIFNKSQAILPEEKYHKNGKNNN